MSLLQLNNSKLFRTHSRVKYHFLICERLLLIVSCHLHWTWLIIWDSYSAGIICSILKTVSNCNVLMGHLCDFLNYFTRVLVDLRMLTDDSNDWTCCCRFTLASTRWFSTVSFSNRDSFSVRIQCWLLDNCFRFHLMRRYGAIVIFEFGKCFKCVCAVFILNPWIFNTAILKTIMIPCLRF